MLDRLEVARRSGQISPPRRRRGGRSSGDGGRTPDRFERFVEQAEGSQAGDQAYGHDGRDDARSGHDGGCRRRGHTEHSRPSSDLMATRYSKFYFNVVISSLDRTIE